MDMKNRDGQGRVVIGIGLIGLGVLFLVNELFNIDLFDVLWPAVIILYGLLFFARMVTGSRQTGRLAIPGSMITMTGLILLVQNVTGRFESWAYAWALIWPTAQGIGLVINGTWTRRPSITRSGWAMVRTGVIIFVVAGAFFELFLGRGDQLLWPILLIAAGAYFLFRRDRPSRGYTEAKSEAQGTIDQEPAQVPEPDA